MIFSTITQNELTLSVDSYNLPTQNSNNIQLKFVQDTENFSGYTPTVAMSLLDSSLISCADVLNEGGFVPIQSDGTFLVQNNILSQDGFLAVAINLTQTTGSTTENIMLGPVVYKIQANISALSPLPPDDNLWQSVVTAFLQSVYDNDYKPQFDQIQQDLENLVTEAQQQQQTAEQQQTQIDNAISVMGEYQIVSNDPVQIQFKQGDGTFGPTVDLGDGLASKSMVNAGYYQSIGSQYSGSASDYGIEVEEIVGAYLQDGTPTPDAPIEPKFVQIENFNTNGGNFFNQELMPTKTQDGITLTNNGDGTFTMVGTPNFKRFFESLNFSLPTDEYNLIDYSSGGFPNDIDERTQIYSYTTTNNLVIKNNQDGNSKSTILLNNASDYRLRFRYESGVNYNVTFKPMLFTGGTGEWLPYKGSTTPASLELMALPNGVADTWKDGTLTHNVASVVFDGSDDENWNTQQTSNPNATSFFIGISNNKSLGYTGMLCDKLTPNVSGLGNTSNVNVCSFNSTNGLNLIMDVANEIATTVEDWKTYLQSNPITVWYQLATPTTEPLAIPTLTSFYPFTNAWCDSIVQPQITWNVLTGRSAILDGLGNLIQEAPMTAPPNGLVNGDFIVNQRGQASYTGNASKYVLACDCWSLDKNAALTMTINPTGTITLTNTSQQDLGIYQALQNFSFPCVAGVKINGLDAQYFIFANPATYVVGTKAKISIMQSGSLYFIKLIVNAGESIEIDYADYWPGEIAYKHIVRSFASEVLECYRYLYVWYAPETPSHGYNDINNLSYFTGVAFPIAFPSTPSYEAQTIMMDSINVTDDLNTINVTPFRCTSVSLTGQISTITATIVFSCEQVPSN